MFALYICAVNNRTDRLFALCLDKFPQGQFVAIAGNHTIVLVVFLENVSDEDIGNAMLPEKVHGDYWTVGWC